MRPCVLSSIPARGAQGLIFTSEHDRQHARRLFRIARIFGAGGHVLVVVVDLPKERLAGQFEGTEVMLSIWIFVRVEVSETLNLSFHLVPQVCHTRGQDHLAAYKGGTKVLVEYLSAT